MAENVRKAKRLTHESNQERELGMTKLNGTSRAAGLSLVERRKYKRLPLRLPVQFRREGSAGSCVTENISNNGFYCISPTPFAPGDNVEVELLLPAHNSGRGENRVRLKCQAQVIRINSTWLGPGFGIGCRIHAYSLRLEEVEC
jgi:hypothetical protein